MPAPPLGTIEEAGPSLGTNEEGGPPLGIMEEAGPPLGQLAKGVLKVVSEAILTNSILLGCLLQYLFIVKSSR